MKDRKGQTAVDYANRFLKSWQGIASKGGSWVTKALFKAIGQPIDPEEQRLRDREQIETGERIVALLAE